MLACESLVWPNHCELNECVDSFFMSCSCRLRVSEGYFTWKRHWMVVLVLECRVLFWLIVVNLAILGYKKNLFYG